MTTPAKRESNKRNSRKDRQCRNCRSGFQRHEHWGSELRISWLEKAGGFTHRNNDAGWEGSGGKIDTVDIGVVMPLMEMSNSKHRSLPWSKEDPTTLADDERAGHSLQQSLMRVGLDEGDEESEALK